MPAGWAVDEWQLANGGGSGGGGGGGGGGGAGSGRGGSAWPELPGELIALVFAVQSARDVRRGAPLSLRRPPPVAVIVNFMP